MVCGRNQQSILQINTMKKGRNARMGKTAEWIYEKSENGDYRFLLGKKGEKMLICCGVNPSMAQPEKYDSTMKCVEKFAEAQGYDGYVMVNLYPLREKNPDKLPQVENKEAVDANKEMIKKLFESIGGEIDIWAAWGTAICKRDYLKECLQEILCLTKKYHCNWYHIGELTRYKHPHHPLYLSNGSKMEKFDIDNYISNL